MDKAEAKFSNMAKRMDAALLQLLEEKPFSSITVTDICKAAGAHRTTFYSHYNNTLDLLNEIKDQTMFNFYSSFEHLPQDDSYKSREYLETYLNFVEDNKKLFKVFLENIKLFDGFGMLMDIQNEMGAQQSSKTGKGKRKQQYELLFVASGVTSIVSYWLESGCKESRRELVEIIIDCLEA